MGKSYEYKEGADHGVATHSGGGGWDGDDGGGPSNDDDEFSRLVAEVYCSFLLLSKSVGGGCGTKEDQQTGKNDAKRATEDAIRTPRRQKQPSLCSPSPSSPFVKVRTDERLHFLRLFTEFIDVSAEEIVCGMGMSRGNHNNEVRRMTDGLWDFARCELIQPEEEEEEFR